MKNPKAYPETPEQKKEHQTNTIFSTKNILLNDFNRNENTHTYTLEIE